MIYYIIIAVIVFIDLITKHFAAKKIPLNSQKEIIKNFFYITNVRNKGAAMGYMSDRPKRLLAVISVTTIILTGILTVLVATGKFAKYKFLLSVLLGGAFGNLIERIKNKYVTDFIYFKYKRLPIFNIADLFIFTTPIIAICCIFI